MAVEYATRTDLLETMVSVTSLYDKTSGAINRIDYLESQIGCCVREDSVLNIPSLSCLERRLCLIEEEIGNIKQALIEIQDGLRCIGMDDMSRRLGDLSLLM